MFSSKLRLLGNMFFTDFWVQRFIKGQLIVCHTVLDLKYMTYIYLLWQMSLDYFSFHSPFFPIPSKMFINYKPHKTCFKFCHFISNFNLFF